MPRKSRVNFLKLEDTVDSIDMKALIMMDRNEHPKCFQVVKELVDLREKGVKIPERLDNKVFNITLFIGAITNNFNYSWE